MLKQRINNDVNEIFDPIRMLWLVETPEEIVRQKFIEFLLSLGYNRGHISVEYGFCLSSKKIQRADIVVFNKNGTPHILIECKAQSIKLTNDVFEQVSKYNNVIKAKFVVITNLKHNFIFQTDNFINYKPITSFPKPE
ncbi:MAG: type I restriction enzyme HsdR N-terminal domain-containing protein [Rikenellaceae bacterium]